MKSWLTILLFILTVSTTSLCESKAETAATNSAIQWLSQVDGGRYEESWDMAAPGFRNVASKDQWAKMLQATRAPLGKVVSREVKSAEYTTSLPGAPDGQYVVIQFESSFETKKSAIETVTPSLASDGQWRVSGYFIR